MRKIVIALPKGRRLLEKAYQIFEQAGFTSGLLRREIVQKERKQLEFESDDASVLFLLVRNADIPQYVDKNWADMGISAFDCYREYELSSVTIKRSMRGDNFTSDIFPDLNLCGAARFCVAGLPGRKSFYEKCKQSDEKILEVATQHPHIAAKYFADQRITADIITISGSSELMPSRAEVDVIFDIVETGQALKENGLILFEEAMPIQTKILVSRAALKYDENMQKMIEVLSNALK